MDGEPSTATTQDDLECMLLDKNAEPTPMAFSLLKQITMDFSDDLEIGRGGFGIVYQGILGNGTVAVKKSTLNAYMCEMTYQQEVQCLVKVKHRNIVRFLGYCYDSQGTLVSHEGKFVMAEKQQRLFCFEYLSNGNLRKYISDASSGLDWRTRFAIINGICEALHHLHEIDIVHLDLKPENILLDDKMVPKITDFGISRCFDEKQTHVTTSNIPAGTYGYMPPEFSSGVITKKFDLYSLGVIIMEILTGEKGFHAVELVLQIWSNRLDKSLTETVLNQVHVCAQIAIQCMKSNPEKRPESTQHIIDMLAGTESTQVIPGSGMLVDAQPSLLHFLFEPDKLIPCSLQLSNCTDEHVAFICRRPNDFIRMTYYGVMPPKSIYTLVLIMRKQNRLERKYADVILEVSTLGNEPPQKFKGEVDYHKFFRHTKRIGGVVQKLKVKAVCTPEEEVMSKHQVPPGIKASYVVEPYWPLHSFDTNPTKQWILTGEGCGRVSIKNYRTQRHVDSFKVSMEPVCSVKFIIRKRWFVAGSKDGFISVYEYGTKMEKIIRFRAGPCVASLAVHPTQPYLLSLAYCQMKLWDWDKGWECTQTFELEHTSLSRNVAFNPMDTDCFAIASEDHTVKVWSLHSRKPIYTLHGHTDKVNSLDFFTRDDQQYLITASNDSSAKIWDLREKTCVYTLKGFLCPVTCAISHPNGIVITGAEDGTVHLWTSNNSRIWLESLVLEQIINIGDSMSPPMNRREEEKKDGSGGSVIGLACLMGSKRILIGQVKTITIVDVDNVHNMEEQADCSEPWLSGKSGLEDTNSEDIHGGSNELLHVHPLELCFHSLPDHTNSMFEPKEMSWCSLYLRNNTDEHVAFSFGDMRGWPSFRPLIVSPRYGIVPPRCTYTVVATARMQQSDLDDQEDRNDGVILQSSILRGTYIHTFEGTDDCGQFFRELKMKVPKMKGNAVHEVTTKAVIALDEEATPQHAIPSSGIKTVWELPFTPLLDIHPTEPLILYHNRYDRALHLWNSETKKEKTERFQIPSDDNKSGMVPDAKANCIAVKFITRTKWLMAGTPHGYIHVFNHEFKIQGITTFRAHDTSIKSLVVHPTKSYVLSTAYDDSKIKLWNWNDGWEDFLTDYKGWECIKIFDGEHSRTVNQVAFDPKDTNIFASASDDHTVKVWSLDSPSSNYTLSGHLDKVNCLDFFTRNEQQYLITGSNDLTAKIWDMQDRKCIHTIESEVFRSPVTSVSSHPNVPVLLTGTKCGAIYLWSSTNFRLKRVISFGRGKVMCFACPIDSKRIVIGQSDAFAIMDIGDEEPVSGNMSNEKS